MHEHEEQDECGSHQLQSQVGHGDEVSQVVDDSQSHDGDGRRIGTPEGDPAAQECQGAGACFTEVDVLTAVFGICGCQLCVAEVSGDLEQAADDEGQNQEQGAACCVGNVSQGGENAGTDSGADAQGDNRTQTQFSTEIVGVGHKNVSPFAFLRRGCAHRSAFFIFRDCLPIYLCRAWQGYHNNGFPVGAVIIIGVTGLPPLPEYFWRQGRQIHRSRPPGHRPG